MSSRTKGNVGNVGDESARRRSSVVSYKKDAKLDEYESLVTFMSDYREDGTGDKEEGKVVENRVWYAPWKKRKFRWKFVGAGQEYPEEWGFTNIHQGLSDSDVEARRRTAGFNELTAKKTNQFRKVLNYFQGPILYGRTDIQNSGLIFALTLRHSYGDCTFVGCGVVRLG
jgi:H+-transporting ATPase